jgi:hypothetical protein
MCHVANGLCFHGHDTKRLLTRRKHKAEDWNSDLIFLYIHSVSVQRRSGCLLSDLSPNSIYFPLVLQFIISL